MAQQKQIWLVSMRKQVRFLASFSPSGIQRCCELWYRSQTWLRSRLLWLWHRAEVEAPMWPLVWEFPHASGAALKRKKKLHIFCTHILFSGFYMYVQYPFFKKIGSIVLSFWPAVLQGGHFEKNFFIKLFLFTLLKCKFIQSAFFFVCLDLLSYNWNKKSKHI